MSPAARSVAASAKSISAAMAQRLVATRTQKVTLAAANWRVRRTRLRERAVDLNQKLRAVAHSGGFSHRPVMQLQRHFYRQIDSKTVKRWSAGVTAHSKCRYDRWAKRTRDISQAIIWRWCLKLLQRHANLPMRRASAGPRRKAQFIRRLKESYWRTGPPVLSCCQGEVGRLNWG